MTPGCNLEKDNPKQTFGSHALQKTTYKVWFCAKVKRSSLNFSQQIYFRKALGSAGYDDPGMAEDIKKVRALLHGTAISLLSEVCCQHQSGLDLWSGLSTGCQSQEISLGLQNEENEEVQSEARNVTAFSFRSASHTQTPFAVSFHDHCPVQIPGSSFLFPPPYAERPTGVTRRTVIQPELMSFPRKMSLLVIHLLPFPLKTISFLLPW